MAVTLTKDDLAVIEEMVTRIVRDVVGEIMQDVYRRFDAIETRLDRIETRLDRVEIRLDRLESKVDAISSIIGDHTIQIRELKQRTA